MPNFSFVVGDSLQIGTATITATGNTIVLPTGTGVGGTQVATTQEVATGGGGGAGAAYFNGYLQDLRLTTGYARYTANFTAPTGAFPVL